MIVGYFQEYIKMKYLLEVVKLYCNPYYFIIEKTITKNNINKLLKYNRECRTTYKRTKFIRDIQDDY